MVQNVTDTLRVIKLQKHPRVLGSFIKIRDDL